jgi:hypothetical protein
MLLRRYHERTEPETGPDTGEEEKATEPEISPVPDEASTKK